MPVMRNAGGYVRVYRSLLEWEWYDDDACTRVMLHLLLSANWEEKRWHGQTIAPGQLVTSMEGIAGKLGLTRASVRRAFDKLKATGEVTIQTNNHWTTVTLANWGEYQEVQPTNGRQKSRPTTNQQPTNNRPPATTKEEKALEEDKKGNTEDGFASAFAAYGSYGGKQPALKSWGKLSEADRAACLMAIPAYVKATNTDGTFPSRKHFSTYLNQRAWEDTPPAVRSVLNIGGGMTKEQADEEMRQIRIKYGRDPDNGWVGDEECSRPLLIYMGRIKERKAV